MRPRNGARKQIMLASFRGWSMIRLDCAAATRVSTERGDIGSGRQVRIEQRVARYLSCSTP